jgi:hypothetical protein
MVSFYSWDSLWIYTNSEGWAVVDYNTANELILRMGRGLTVGAEAKALFDGATATMQGANLIENEYAPLSSSICQFFLFHNRVSWVSCFFWSCI